VFLLVVTEGRGVLKDAHTVEVTTSSGEKRTLKTKYVLLAVGGKPVKAPIPGAVRMPAIKLFSSLHLQIQAFLVLWHSSRLGRDVD